MSDIQLPHPGHSGKISNSLLEGLQDPVYFSPVTDLFQELSDPTGIRLFWLLTHQEVCVANAAVLLGVSADSAAAHLHRLYALGLAQCRISGKEVLYTGSETAAVHDLHILIERVTEIPCPEKEVDYDASSEEIIRKVHAYLMENLDSRVTIEELSRIFLMNTTTLKAAFKKVYGTSIAAHMKQHRMHRAARLLLTTRDDISVIARAVGYESQSRFSAAFREVFHVLPTEYRKNHEGDSLPDEDPCP